VRTACLAVALSGFGIGSAVAQRDDTPRQVPDASSSDVSEQTSAPRMQPAPNWLRVTKNHEVWIDFAQKKVIVGGSICLREGMLEMFACPRGTKEHESVVAVHAPARYVHAALVAVGAQPGPPVRFEPTYQPAQGTEISVEVLWHDTQGQEHRAPAQEWVKHTPTGEALKYPWVFAGSGFWTDPDGQEQFYYADGGEFICVSNFSTAMLDLPVESSAANDTLLFSAFTERIPPRGTPVQLVLTPKLDKPAEDTATPPQKDAAPAKAPAPGKSDPADTEHAPPAEDKSGETPPVDGLRFR